MGLRGPNARPVKRQAVAAKPKVTRRLKGSRSGRVVDFCQTLTITAGRLAGSRLVLEDWQREAIEEVYRTDGAGTRPVRLALASLPRKCGKSTFASSLALCHLAGPEAVSRGQVLSAAADRTQAAIVYNEIRAFGLASAELAERLVFRDFAKTIEDVVTGSTYGALSSDAKKAHGLSPVFFIADEVAQWRNRALLDALMTGQGAHAEPLGWVISTRSPDPTNPLEELIQYAADVKAGIIEDPTFASFIYSAPMDADPFDEATWRAAVPGLGRVRSIEDLRAQAVKAKRLPSALAAFRAYMLNTPIAPDDRFIGPADWDACNSSAEPAGRCFGSLDLASGAADLTAFALYWPETHTLRVWGFLPAALVDQKAHEDRAPYRDWISAGHIIPIPGRAIDRAWLAGWIAETTSALDLQGVALDRWGLNDFRAVLDREGIELPLEPHGAGFKDMSPSLTAFEGAVLGQKLAHDANPLLRWSVANAVIDMDPAGNRKLSKQRARGRIDPLVAAAQAVGLASRTIEETPLSFEYDLVVAI